MKKFIKKIFFNNSSLVREDKCGYQQSPTCETDTHPQPFPSKGRWLSAFTMAEIVVALVVMAIVASVVVPITRDKFEKVDYASYYLGYKTVQNFNFLLQKEVQAEEDRIASGLEEGGSDTTGTCSLSSGSCFQTPVGSADLGYLTKAECEAVKDSLGIEICPTDKDYWAAIVQHCGGVQYLPTYEETQRMVSYLYGIETTIDESGSGGGYTGFVNNGTLNREHATILGVPEDMYPVIVNSNVSSTGVGASYPSCSSDNVIWWNYGRDCCSNAKSFLAFCKTPAGLGGIKDPFAEEEEEEDNSSSDTVSFKTATGYCEILFKNFNIPETLKSCDGISTSLPQAIATKDFSFVNPNLTLPNGLKIYIASDYGEIEALNDSVDENDRTGFIVYVDVDGRRSKTRLYDDVFPFYLTKSGKVIPGYDSSTVAGANCEKNLAFDILYDKFSSGNRKTKKFEAGSVTGSDLNSFKNTACVSGYVRSLKYCGISPDMAIIYDDVDCKTNEAADCRLKVRKPLRIFR